jgi:hypothetical protein
VDLLDVSVECRGHGGFRRLALALQMIACPRPVCDLSCGRISVRQPVVLSITKDLFCG